MFLKKTLLSLLSLSLVLGQEGNSDIKGPVIGIDLGTTYS